MSSLASQRVETKPIPWMPNIVGLPLVFTEFQGLQIRDVHFSWEALSAVATAAMYTRTGRADAIIVSNWAGSVLLGASRSLCEIENYPEGVQRVYGGGEGEYL